ncbi:MAG: DNA polymerase I [bacterium]
MKRIILVDGNSLMYRAYYATAYTGNLMQNTKGLYTNAIFAFIKMMSSLTKQKYDGMLVAFDKSKKTFRHELNESYKDGRSPMPDEFRVQIPYIKKFLDLHSIKQYELLMYEADDIIGTMAQEAVKAGYQVDIYSSDKDMLQLVNEDITVHMNKKGMTELDSFTPETLFEKYGLTHKQMIDFKALMGDPSDNLKGIAGVGEKTAIKLLQEYETLENLIANVESIKGKMKEKIEAGKEDALLCQTMCTIKLDTPIDITLDDILSKKYDENELNMFYQDLEFHSLLKKLVSRPQEDVEFTEINTTSELLPLLTNDNHLLFETLGYNYHNEEIIAIGLSNNNKSYILSLELLKDKEFINYLENEDITKKVYDVKKSIVLLLKHNINLKNVVYDMRLATYLVDPNIKNESFKLNCDIFDYTNIPYEEEVYNKGAKLSVPSIDVLNKYISKKLLALTSLESTILTKIKENNQIDLLEKVEIPLAFVLAEMENTGIKIDQEELSKQEISIKKKIDEVQNEIYQYANEEFNIGSVKQLGEVLFEKLNLPVVKKNKTGYSTDIAVLEELYDKHPIIKEIIKYRTLTKLHSTYLEGLKNQIYPDGKIHTIFEQALTNTGRLSSIEPNLQNIPVRTEEGKQIRKVFIPQENYKIIATDYSQIELRVLAHMARVNKLIDAFNNNEDIHTKTAQEIFCKNEITALERQKAKAVNFGIVYGISAFGLSNDLGIGVYQAKEYIEKYLELYPEIKLFMENIVEYAKTSGYVVTLLNRRRYINELKSPNYQQREFGKRTAMNAPIQGSAADIIKIAMIKVNQKIKENNLRCNMLITVHDEIVLECHKDDVQKACEVINQAMNKAMKLSVKLECDTSVADNWMEAK